MIFFFNWKWWSLFWEEEKCMTKPQGFKVVLKVKRNLRTNILFQTDFSSLLLGRTEGGTWSGNPLSWPVMLLKTAWRVFSSKTSSHTFQCESEGSGSPQRLASPCSAEGLTCRALSVQSHICLVPRAGPVRKGAQARQEKNHGLRMCNPRAYVHLLCPHIRPLDLDLIANWHLSNFATYIFLYKYSCTYIQVSLFPHTPFSTSPNYLIVWLWNTNRFTGVCWILAPPKNVYVVIPRIFEYVTLHGIRHFAGMIKLQVSRWGEHPIIKSIYSFINIFLLCRIGVTSCVLPSWKEAEFHVRCLWERALGANQM